MKIIWLASYPKTGGTYLSSLLYSYFYGPIDKSTDLSEQIPDINDLSGKSRALNLKSDKTTFVKGHYMYSEEHPYLDHMIGFIYLIRNPRDILLSSAKMLGATQSNELLRINAKNFIDNLGDPKWDKLGFGNIPENFGSWLCATGRFPHLFIKYEELRNDPALAMEKLITFCGQPVNFAKINQAISNCSLEKSRALEMKEKEAKVESIYPVLPGGNTFVGEGKMGQSLNHIGPDIEDYYKLRFGKFLNVMGYSE